MTRQRVLQLALDKAIDNYAWYERHVEKYGESPYRSECLARAWQEVLDIRQMLKEERSGAA